MDILRYDGKTMKHHRPILFFALWDGAHKVDSIWNCFGVGMAGWKSLEIIPASMIFINLYRWCPVYQSNGKPWCGRRHGHHRFKTWWRIFAARQRNKQSSGWFLSIDFIFIKVLIFTFSSSSKKAWILKYPLRRFVTEVVFGWDTEVRNENEALWIKLFSTSCRVQWRSPLAWMKRVPIPT